MTVLVATMLMLIAVSGAGVVLARDPRRMVLALSANGLILAVLFVVLQAPDVAFAELAVGAAAVPLLFLVVIGRVRADTHPGDAGPPVPPP